MKFLVALFAVLLSTVVAMASPGKKVELLTEVKVDGQLTTLTGLLEINFGEKTLTAQLFEDPCHNLNPTPGKPQCKMAAILKKTITVPVQSTQESCGSISYSGMVDKTPVDGVKTEMTFVDNTFRVCEDVVLGRLVVHATVFNPWTQTTTTYQLLEKQ